jgi:tetratricopeptide (TPR) repeat protein
MNLSPSATAAEQLARGWQNLRVGDFDAAERSARAVLAAEPGAAAATQLLAIALMARSRHREAVPLFESLAESAPDDMGTWVNLGTSLRGCGRFEEAARAYERASGLGASGPDFDFNVGLLHIDRGDYEAARAALRKAHAAAPLDGEISYHYAAACSETLDTQAGIAALAPWPRFTGLTTESVGKIAALLVNLGDTAGAEGALARATADPSPSPEAILQFVLALERLNRVAEAGRWLERLAPLPVDALGPDLLLARARMAQREHRHEGAAALYRELVATTPEPDRRHVHQYPLARELDALGRHDEAFAAASEAHASQTLWTERIQPEIPALRSDTMRVTRFGCDPADVAAWDATGAPSFLESPIFIVAFPRSGTTLLEQVLDAHPRLRSMDEQPYLQNAMEALSVGGSLYPARMAPLNPDQLEAARALYWRLVAQRVRLAPGEQLIDKNPLNVLRLPAIARLFPHARILLAIRHPCDVLVSCYLQHFRAEFAWHCRDMATLGLAYRRAMDFWFQQAALLRPAAREVRYELFVANFEQEVRGVAEFLDLPWTDAMLEPGQHAARKGYISTPSYAQVLQPVHLRSIDRWRAYERHLLPAAAQLAPYFDRWGYLPPGVNSR